MAGMNEVENSAALKVENTGKRAKKTRAKKALNDVNIYVNATYNNTKIAASDVTGAIFYWASAGSMGIKGSRKSTPFAASSAAERVAKYIQENFTVTNVHIIIKGPGPGREAAIRAISTFLTVKSIHDKTGIPHNGCKPKKKRRV